MFLRLPKVIEQTGLSRSAIYKLISKGLFPSPVRIGQRAVAWRAKDLADWASGRAATH